MNRDRERFAEAGVPPILIGQGTPGRAAAFRERYELELDLLADTDRLAYKAAGTKVGTLPEVIGPKMVLRGLKRSLQSGVFQGNIDGHPAQLGGMMLVLPGGRVPWVHLSDDVSDYPPNAEVIDAVREALSHDASRPAPA